MSSFADEFLTKIKKLYVILYLVRRKSMKTKEKNMTREMILLLSFVSILVFCSFVVSYQITDILYFLVVIAYIIYYKLGINKENEDKEFTSIR